MEHRLAHPPSDAAATQAALEEALFMQAFIPTSLNAVVDIEGDIRKIGTAQSAFSSSRVSTFRACVSNFRARVSAFSVCVGTFSACGRTLSACGRTLLRVGACPCQHLNSDTINIADA